LVKEDAEACVIQVTSHIQGLFNRTIRMMTNGIKPVYVFDGKPPTLKSGELAKRCAPFLALDPPSSSTRTAHVLKSTTPPV
jgi:5'-3' exonuclease